MDLLGKTVIELKELLKQKQISSMELKQYFLDRIEKHNPKLNAYLTVDSKQTKLKKEKSSILSGIPIAVKDNFCTKDIKTTASSKVLEDFVPPYDATVVAKLKEAGADVLGKTNMDAWAHGSSTETSDFVTTKNSWDLERVPGGSSGGSAVAVSTYMAPLAIGSETAGSIRQPSAWSGVVGLKPTYGRVSRYGVVAMASSTDSPGPMGLCVEDMALALEVLAGKDLFDATTSPTSVPKYSREIKKTKKFTIGIPKKYFKDIDQDVASRLEESLKILAKMGHKVKEIELLDPKYSISVYTIVQRAEVSSNLARYHGIRYSKSREVMGDEAKRRIMLGTYALAHGYYDAYYKKAQKVRNLIIEDFAKIYKEVDLIIAPTAPMTALKIGESANYPFFGELMDILLEPSSVAGLPAINLPVGLDQKGLPVGMQIMGDHFKESDIMNLAYQFEQETDYFGVIKKGIKNYA